MSDIEAILAKATPRLWKIFIDDSGDEFTGWPSIISAPDIDTTVIHRAGFKQRYWQGTSERETHANAALIAAAVNALEPMREALKIAVEALDVEQRDPGSWVSDVFRDALARIRELVPDLVTDLVPSTEVKL